MEATTEDHVVARGFFPAAPAEGYIKVPSCAPCNRSFSRDEEYFLAAVLAEGSWDSEAALAVLERLREDHRSGKRPRAGLAVRLLESVEQVEAVSPGGLYLGKGPAVRLEVDRINRVLEKIVRGLFFHEFGRRLSDDADIHVEIKPDQAMLDRPPLLWVRSEYARPAKKLGDVFLYRVCAVKDAPDCTAWLLVFYDRIPAAAVTVKRPDGAAV